MAIKTNHFQVKKKADKWRPLQCQLVLQNTSTNVLVTRALHGENSFHTLTEAVHCKLYCTHEAIIFHWSLIRIDLLVEREQDCCVQSEYISPVSTHDWSLFGEHIFV